MANAHVQSQAVQSSGAVSSLAGTFSSTTVTGRWIVVCVSWYGTGATTVTFTVTDNKGNTYATVTGSRQEVAVGGDKMGTEIFRAQNITGGASHQVTVTPSRRAFVSATRTECSGGATSGLSDQGNSGTGSSTSPSSGAITLGASADMVVGVVTHAAGGTVTLTSGSGYTLAAEQESTANQPVHAEYKTGASGSQTATFTLGSSAQWTASVASFNAAGAAPAAPWGWPASFPEVTATRLTAVCF